MAWVVNVHDDFEQELASWGSPQRVELAAVVELLKSDGPNLGRPWVDTLNDSRYPNMKELRFSCYGVKWRVAFAFDPSRQAILLVGGGKSGVSQRLFYRRLIRTADARYAQHLELLRDRRLP